MGEEKRLPTPDWRKAPEAGWILAVSVDGEILFERYRSDGEKLCFPGAERLEGKQITRCHCFDEQAEYRYLCVGQRRRVIETVCSAAQESDIDPDLLYEDEQILEQRYAPGPGVWKIRVINRYRYGETDTLVLENFRLGGVYPVTQGDNR